MKNKKTKHDWKKFDAEVKKSIEQDPAIISFWEKYFTDRIASLLFIKNCLRKTTTRRMMLRVKWYVDIADDMQKYNRPALQIIFLMSMAESIAGNLVTKKKALVMGSQKIILDFFKRSIASDKKELESKFKRSLKLRGSNKLRFSSIIRILYNVRNNAVHGEEYWGFSLFGRNLSDEEKEYYSLLTVGHLGKPKRKRRVDLDIKLSYENLRDIFVRTSIENINILL